jgi:hypothetical protein
MEFECLPLMLPIQPRQDDSKYCMTFKNEAFAVLLFFENSVVNGVGLKLDQHHQRVNYRRQLCGLQVPAGFYDPDNKEGSAAPVPWPVMLLW